MLRTDIESKDVFISWTGKDRAVKDRIVEFLEQNGIGCLESDYACSGDFEQWSRQAATKCSVFLLIYTEHTADSIYVPIEVNVFKEQDDWKNRLVPVVMDRKTYDADPFAVHATTSAVFCDGTMPDEAALQQILNKVQRLVIGRLHHTYFENTRPKHIRLVSLHTKTIADKQHDYAKLYVRRTLTEINKNGDTQGTVKDARQLVASEDICCIIGAAGSGKTLYLQQMCEAAGAEIITIVLPCHTVAESEKDVSTLLFETFTSKCGNHVFYSENNFKALLQSRRLLLALDGMDEISTMAGTRKMVEKVEAYLSANGENTTAVFTTRNESDAKLLEIAGRNVRRFRLDMLCENDMRKLSENLFFLFGIPEKNNEFYLRVQQLNDEIKTNPLLLSQLAIVYKESGDIPTSIVGIYDAIANITFSLEKHKDVLDVPPAYSDMMGNMSGLLRKFAYTRYNELSKGKNHPAQRLFAAVLEENYADDYEERACFLAEYLQDRAILVENEFYHKMFLEYFTAADYCGQIFSSLGSLKNEGKLAELLSHYGQPYWEAVIKLFLLKADTLVDEQTTRELYTRLLEKGVADYTPLFDLCDDLSNNGETVQNMLVADILEKTVDGAFSPYGPLFWYVPTYHLYAQLAQTVAIMEEDACFVRAVALLRDVCWTCGGMQTITDATNAVCADTLFERAKPYLFGVRGALVELFLTGKTAFEGGADIYPRCFNVAEAKSWLENGCGLLDEMTVPFEDELGLYTHTDIPIVNDEYIGWVSLPYDVQAVEETLAQKSCRKVTGLLLTPTENTQFSLLSINKQQIRVLYIPENIATYHTWWDAYPRVARYIYVDGTRKLYFNRVLRLPQGVVRVGWAKHCAVLQDVYLPDTVTSITQNAFLNCTALRCIQLAEGVEKIGAFAFAGCTSLQEIYLPQTLITLGDAAFSQCRSLKEITLPGGLQKVGDQSFAGCKKLQRATLAEGISCVPYAMFQRCEALAELSLPTTITEIESGAFLGCSALLSVHLPQGVKRIEEGAFAGCKQLEEIVLPDEMEEIEKGTFWECYSLKSVCFPRGVAAVADETFAYCKHLTEITLPKGIEEIGMKAFADCEKLCNIELPDTVTEIGAFAFQNCTSLTEIHIPDGVDTIRPHTFSFCFSLKRITNLPADYDLGKPAWLSRDAVVEYRTAPIMEEYVVPVGITVIEPHAFENWKTLKSIHLPEGLVEIGENAFAGCTHLEKLEIPEGVTVIGDNAFLGCEKLWSVSLPQSLQRIGNKAFVGCKALHGVKLPSNLTSLGFGTFEGSGLWVARIPNGVHRVESFTFANCEGLEEVWLPPTLKRIDDKAFFKCIALQEVHIPDSVEHIGESAFESCIKLERATLPKNLNRLSRRMFDFCIELTEMHIPDTVTVFEERCFAGCLKLQQINIPYGVTEIENQALMGCGALREIILPDTVRKIGGAAFGACTSLETLRIPEGVEYIDNGMAGSCSSLQQVVLPQTVKSILWESFKNCRSLREITIPDGVTRIDEDAFRGCESLETLVIPPSVRSLGNSAFKECTGLRSVTLSRRFEDEITRVFGAVDSAIFHFV